MDLPQIERIVLVLPKHTFTHKKIWVWVLGLDIYPYIPKIVFDTQKIVCIEYGYWYWVWVSYQNIPIPNTQYTFFWV